MAGVGASVRALLLAAILLPGCVGELLAPEAVTTRTVTCAFLDPERDLELVHRIHPPVDEGLAQDLSAQWVSAVADVTGRDLDRFTWRVDVGGPQPEPLRDWAADQGILEGPVSLQVLWVERVPAARALDEQAPAGVVVINATAVAAAADGLAVARILLFHGLGHALGVVNWGVPLHDRGGPQRESPMHHEPGGVMSAAWHQPATFPANTTPRAYSDAIVADWRHAAQEVCP